MPISEGETSGIVGQEGFILIAIDGNGNEEVLLALTGEGAEEGIQAAAATALETYDRLEVRLGIAPIDLTWH